MIVRKSYYFKKYIVHALVAGAMVVSWGTIFHVNDYVHSHVKTTGKRSRGETLPDESSPNTTDKSSATDMSSGTTQPSVSGDSTSLPSKLHPMAPVVIPVAIFDKATETSKDVVKDTQPKVIIASASSSNATIAQIIKTPPMKKIQVHFSSIKTSDLTPVVASKLGISITQTQVDTNFIRKMEGSVLKGYVPLAATTRSGVTIGDGFDLGQMKPGEFNKLPLDEALKQKLRPYVGLIKFKAKAFLKIHPLTINEEELKQVNVVAADKILVPLVKQYDKDSHVPFQKLPANAQTVIFSYAYQHGPGFSHKGSGKKLWSCFVNQNWNQASAMLHAAKQYKPRRQQEARLLDNIA